LDPDGRDSISIDFFNNAFFNFGFLEGAGLGTWEDYYNWQAETFTPVSSNYSFDPTSLTIDIHVAVFAPFYPRPVIDAATGLLTNPTGYEEPGIQDTSFEFVTTVVPVTRAVVGIGAAIGRGLVDAISSSEVRSITTRLIADETGAIRMQSGGSTIGAKELKTTACFPGITQGVIFQVTVPEFDLGDPSIDVLAQPNIPAAEARIEWIIFDRDSSNGSYSARLEKAIRSADEIAHTKPIIERRKSRTFRIVCQ
jgi:hypothetical protein